MLAAGFAAFFTGVTEPLEFAFMFLAPALYFVHAVLTGISLLLLHRSIGQQDLVLVQGLLTFS